MTDPVVDHCRQILEGGSKSFTRAAALLDPEIRIGAYQLYAWCRYCDDVIDGQSLGHGQQLGDPAVQRVRLAELRSITSRALAGQPVEGLVFQGIARVVERHGIPPHMPFELLEGMAMDVAGRRYRTFDELRLYCYRVAGVVGVMMAHIMGVRDEATLKRAAEVGTAMQVSNISRDVIDDARVGRVYLPLDWLDEASIPPDRINRPEHRAALVPVVRRLLERGDQLYRSADSGIDHLPFRSVWAIAAARYIYSDLGRLIRARGEEAWNERTYVGAARKMWWLAWSFGQAAFGFVTRSQASEA